MFCGNVLRDPVLMIYSSVNAFSKSKLCPFHCVEPLVNAMYAPQIGIVTTVNWKKERTGLFFLMLTYSRISSIE